MHSKLVPELFSCIASKSCQHSFKKDILSGIIVGIVALPLAIAFAIASGVKPEQGLFTAVIGGFIISAFGGSRVQIGGPTGAFIVVVYDIVQKFGYEGLAMATLMAGLILIAMGFLKLGAVIKFIPYPMTIGFTSGIALIIAATQINPLLGLNITEKGDGFLSNLMLSISHLNRLNTSTLFISFLSLAIILIWPKITRKLPGSIIAIVVSTLVVYLFHLDVATIGSAFGSVPSSLPLPHIPTIDPALLPQLFPHALTIAILAAIESLLSAVVADGMTGYRHRSNMELVAQGFANVLSPLFMGIPATGAIARTATNVKNGGSSPVSGITHAVTLLMILMLFGRLATMIPLAALAAVLLVVAYHMSEWRVFLKLFRSPKYDIFVMLLTFFLTVFMDLTIAIEIGVVVSSLLFMYRMANLTEIKNIKDELLENYDEDDEEAIYKKSIPHGVEVFEIYGPFFFGAAQQFKDTLTLLRKTPTVLILRMRHIMSIDATGLRALEDVLINAEKRQTHIVISGIGKGNLAMLQRSGIEKRIGKKNICQDIDHALDRARELL
jgi:sulfate permease, SulP family